MIKDTWERLMDYTTWSADTYEYESEVVMSIQDATEMSNEHAKDHVKAAVQSILENPELTLSERDKEIIQNSYLLTNIK